MLLPKWVSDTSHTDEERQALLLRFQLKMAALLHNKEGSLAPLSEAAGFSPNYLQTRIGRGSIPKRALLAVKGVVGADPFDFTLPDEL